MPDIYRLAYDGDLEGVRRELETNMALLDAPYDETSPVGPIVWGALEKSVGALLGLFAFAGAAAITVETAGVGSVITGTTTAAAAKCWTIGSADFSYAWTNKRYWTPLDFAALGYVMKNERALEVGLYLIGLGANGAGVFGRSDVRFFEMMEGSSEKFIGPCRQALRTRSETEARFQRIINDSLSRVTDLEIQKRDLTRELTRISTETATINASLSESQRGGEALLTHLRTVEGELGVLQHRLKEMKATHGDRFKFFAHFPEGHTFTGQSLFRGPRAEPESASRQGEIKP